MRLFLLYDAHTCAKPQPAPCCTADQGVCSWGACHWCRTTGNRLKHGAPLLHHKLREKQTLYWVGKKNQERSRQGWRGLNLQCWPDSSRWCSCWLPVRDVWLRMSDMRAELSAFPAKRLMPDMGSAWSWAEGRNNSLKKKLTDPLPSKWTFCIASTGLQTINLDFNISTNRTY